MKVNNGTRDRKKKKNKEIAVDHQCPNPRPLIKCQPSLRPPAKYDYIVIGAGAAGATLANHLTLGSRPGTTVLLLEAGVRRLEEPNTLFPLGAFGAYNAADQNVGPYQDPKFSWQTALEPDSGRYGTRQVLANGRQWGGSSAINFMVYVNGGRTVYDQEWPPGWHYDDLRPYFAEIGADIDPYRDPTKLVATQVYLRAMKRIASRQLHEGVTSWLTNVATGHTTRNIEKASPNAPQLDYNDIEGVNSVCAFSAWFLFVNELPDGTFIRKFAGNTYLNASQVDPETGHGLGPLRGLTVESGAFVNRILFESGTVGLRVGRHCSKAKKPRARWVAYTGSSGEGRMAKARHEVIVSGGAFQSPALIQRSGVGDVPYLESVGIAPVARNDQVGRNLRNSYAPLTAVKVVGSAEAVAAFMQEMYVPQPYNLGFHGGAFLNFHPLDPNKPANFESVSYRKYQTILIGNTSLLPAAAGALYDLPPSSTDAFLLAMDSVRFAPVGYVQAPNSSVANDTPNVFYNTFVTYTPTTAPPDQQWPAVQVTLAATISAILGYDIVRQIVCEMNAVAAKRGLGVELDVVVPAPSTLLDGLALGLARYGATWWHYLVPSLVYGEGEGTPEQVAFAAALDQLAYFARTVSFMDDHQMGTDRLGHAVDTDCRLRGVGHLRVSDLSIAAAPPGGNTCAPSMVVGAVTADRILGIERPVCAPLTSDDDDSSSPS